MIYHDVIDFHIFYYCPYFSTKLHIGNLISKLTSACTGPVAENGPKRILVLRHIYIQYAPGTTFQKSHGGRWWEGHYAEMNNITMVAEIRRTTTKIRHEKQNIVLNEELNSMGI